MGGGNAAVDAANFLTKYASHLYLIHRSQLRADKSSQDALYANPKVTVMLETEIMHLSGEDRLTSVELLHKDMGKTETLAVDSIPLCRGQPRLCPRRACRSQCFFPGYP